MVYGRTLLARTALSLAVVLSAGLALALPNYTVTNLGTLGGDSGASGLNELGHVVGGSVAADGQTHAFIWRPGTGIEDIGTAGQTMGAATGINDYNIVCGYAGPWYDRREAYRWEYAGGTWTHVWLGELNSKYPYGCAMAVNNAGQITGTDITGLASGAFIWEEGTGMRALGSMSHGQDINESGQVAGLI